MDKLLAITLLAFQETLRRRVFYIVLLLSLLVLIGISSEVFYLRMARQAGETQVLTRAGAQLTEGILGIWNFAVLFLALFLGSIGVSSEISARTIVHVMSRPVKRWIYLLGRWLGLLMFLWAFLLIGILGALLVTLRLKVPFAPVLWLGLAEMFVDATFYSGVALALSIVLPSVAAGVLTFLLTILPGILGDPAHHPLWFYRLPALAGYYIGPARMPVNLISDSFSNERLHSDYWLYFRVLVENLWYVAAMLILASLIFRRRELRVR